MSRKIWIHFSEAAYERWKRESQPPGGELLSVDLTDIDICEGAGCYNGLAHIHAHAIERWENGAVCRVTLPISTLYQALWLATYHPDLIEDRKKGDGWA